MYSLKGKNIYEYQKKRKIPFASDIIIHLENPILIWTKEFSKLAGYKTNVQKLIVCVRLCVCVCNGNQLEGKIRENPIYNNSIKDKNTWKINLKRNV